MLDTHPDREPTLGKGEDLGISQLGSFITEGHLGLWSHSGTQQCWGEVSRGSLWLEYGIAEYAE